MPSHVFAPSPAAVGGSGTATPVLSIDRVGKDYAAPVSLTLFIDSSSESAVGPMFAMSLLSLIPVFLFFVAFQRMLVEGINTSGLKG